MDKPEPIPRQRNTKKLRASFGGGLRELSTEQLIDRVNHVEEQLAQSKLVSEALLLKLNERNLNFARVSHDLRQPIHAASLFVAASKLETDPVRIAFLMERLDRSLAGIDDLLAQMLDTTKLDAEAEPSSVQEFALGPLLETIEARFLLVAQKRGLSWKVICSRPLSVRTNPTILIEILMNLLSNAFRYTNRGGVRLTVRCKDNAALFQVWDTGVGISKAHLPSIFNDFYQIRNSVNTNKSNAVGNGLGLGIVKRLAASLGVGVNVRSVVGQGSRFEVKLPLAASSVIPTASVGEVVSGTNPLSGSLVLVVDDNPDVLMASQALLTNWKVHVLLARSPAEARQQIELCERLPDVIVSDHDLSLGQTSSDVIKACRLSAGIDIPVLILSADVPGNVFSGTPLVAVLRKPVSAGILFKGLCALQAEGINQLES